MPEVTLPQGTIAYTDEGPPASPGAPVVVFVHGFLVDSSLWQPVLQHLRGEVRCIAPDLPLGSHRTPMNPGADLTPRGLAQLIADFLEALDLRDVTLVGNDSGGALSQLVAVHHPQRLGGLVLTDCDAFDNFPPKAFRGLITMAKVPGLLTAAMQPLRLEAPRRLPLAYGWLTRRKVPRAVTDRWVQPFLRDAGVRRDARKILVGLDPQVLLDAAPRLAEFDRPALLVWAPEDRFFPIEHARRLAAILPQARVEEVPDSYTFISWDQPSRLATLLREFVTARGATPAGTRRPASRPEASRTT
jgi:pimeloyl-ACP methyl ester carboxylesterase